MTLDACASTHEHTKLDVIKELASMSNLNGRLPGTEEGESLWWQSVPSPAPRPFVQFRSISSDRAKGVPLRALLDTT